MKEKINKFIESIDKVSAEIESRKCKNKYKKLKESYELLCMENMANVNEITILKEEARKLQMEKREYLNAYKHIKEQHRQIKMMLMKDGTTLKDIKNAMGVK